MLSAGGAVLRSQGGHVALRALCALIVVGGFAIGASSAAHALTPASTHDSGSPNPAAQGQSVTITGNVQGASCADPPNCTIIPGPTPTGTIQFRDGAPNGPLLGSAPLAPKPATTNTATGSITVTFATAGNHDVYILYSGDLNYNSQNDVYTQVITAGATAPTSSTPTDSQNASAVAQQGSSAAAAASGAASATAIGNGIQAGFDSGSGGTQVSANGGGLFVAYGPEGPGASSTNPLAFAPNAKDGKFRFGSKDENDPFSAMAYASIYKAKPRISIEWSLWASVLGAGLDRNDGALHGRQINLTGGIGRLLTPNLLVGVFTGYENFRYDFPAIAGSLKGNGATIGGYGAWKFGQGLRLDGALGYSRINYNPTAGAAVGSFNGDRLLALLGLTGTYAFAPVVLEPSVNLYSLWEKQNAWTDSLGTLQASRNFSSGRLASGGRVLYPVTDGATNFTPYVGLYGDYRFAGDNATPVGAPVLNIGNGWSGRVRGGVSAKPWQATTLSLDGDYGGLGANYKIWTLTGRARVDF